MATRLPVEMCCQNVSGKVKALSHIDKTFGHMVLLYCDLVQTNPCLRTVPLNVVAYDINDEICGKVSTTLYQLNKAQEKKIFLSGCPVKIIIREL